MTTHAKSRTGVFARSSAQESRRSPRLAALLVMTITGFLLGMLWMAATTTVPELTRASGALVPTGHYRQIQTPENGIVSDVRIREGQKVERGELLARLSSLALEQQDRDIRQEIAALRLKQRNFRAVLAATANGQAPAEDLTEADMRYAATQIALMHRREQVQAELTDRLSETMLTLERARDLAAKRVRARTAALGRDEELFAKGLTTARDLDAQRDRLDQLQASLMDVEVRLSQVQKELSMSRSNSAQSRLALQEKYSQQVFELDLQERVLLLQAEAVAARLTSLQIRAPETGVVHAVGFPNPGEVVAAGDILFEILPTGQNLVAEIEVNPLDIGHIAAGDAVALKFDTFDPRRYGQARGEIISISPNSVTDRATGQEHFRVTVALAEPTIGQGIWHRQLQSGMTTTAEIVTDERTVLAYMLKPINRSLENAFGER